jgi:hypothetical protein
MACLGPLPVLFYREAQILQLGWARAQELLIPWRPWMEIATRVQIFHHPSSMVDTEKRVPVTLELIYRPVEAPPTGQI